MNSETDPARPRPANRDLRERELRAELEAHLELEAADLVARGIPPDEARLSARRTLGSVAAIQDDVRDVWRWASFAQAWQDTKYALRTLRRSPLWTATALVALALGIGANTAIFSLADALLFRPLAVRDPGRVLTISTASPETPSEGLSYADFQDVRDSVTTASALLAYRMSMVGVATTPESLPQMRMAMSVSRDFFQTLGIVPQRGRPVLPEESETHGRDAVAILSHDFWQSAFAADPGVVGRSIRVSQTTVTVVGIAPQSFTGMHPVMRPALYIPLTLTMHAAASAEAERGQRTLTVKARLSDDTTRNDLQARLDGVARSLAGAHPATNANRTFVVRSEIEARATDTPELVGLVSLLGGLTLLVLAIACANVANLLLARAQTRSREVAIRLAIGSGPGRLVRQMLTESAVLAVLGGLLGLAVATGVTRYLRSISLPTDVPLVLNVQLDGRAVLVSLAAAILSAVAFGVIPAWRTTRTDLVEALKRLDTPAPSRRRVATSVLVVAQVALSVVLLTAAALLVDAFRKATIADPGIRTDHIMMIELDPGLASYSPREAELFYERLLERVRALPGVASATLAAAIPFRPNFSNETVVVEGYEPPAGQVGDRLPTNAVDDRYFETMRVPIVRGRGVTADDRASARRTVVINEAFAARYWPNQDAIGRRLRLHPDGQWLEVVGVARTGKYRFLGEAPQPYVYLPLSQHPRSRLTLLTETTGEPIAAADRLRQAVREIDPQVPVYNVRPLDRFYADGVLGTQRLILQIVSAMGIVGLSLAVVGLYAVIAYSASRRMREFAIRLAVGATPATVLRLVLRDGAVIALIGIVAGLVLSVPVHGVLRVALVGLGPLSTAVFVIVPLGVLAATLAACAMPAWRSSLVEPVSVLRLE